MAQIAPPAKPQSGIGRAGRWNKRRPSTQACEPMAPVPFPRVIESGGWVVHPPFQKEEKRHEEDALLPGAPVAEMADREIRLIRR
ncbi:hypothetical protein [Azospirillum doebereinerae]